MKSIKTNSTQNLMHNDDELSEMLRVFFNTRKKLKVDLLSKADNKVSKDKFKQPANQ